MANSNEIAASSKTYRKATNLLAGTLGMEPQHSSSPKNDYEETLGKIDPAFEKFAWKGYRRGVRRGFIAACDALLKKDGELTFDDNVLVFNKPFFEITVSIRYRGNVPKKRKIRFKPEDLQFYGDDDG